MGLGRAGPRGDALQDRGAMGLWPYKRLANEVLRMEATLAIVNPWDIPDPAERDPLWDVLQDWEICGAGKSRTPCGCPTRSGRCGVVALQAVGQRGLERDETQLGHRQPLGHP